MKKILLSLVMVLATMMATAQVVIPLQESFENGLDLPAGWSQQYMRGPITLDVDTVEFSWNVEAHDSLAFPRGAADGVARIAARNSTTDEMRFITRLVTPVLNLTAPGLFRPQLHFSHAEAARAGVSDTLRVYYRTSASDLWRAYPGAVYTRNAAWKEETLDVVSPSNTYQFAFEITENMGYGVVLDNISVRSTPTCRDVTDVRPIVLHAFDATIVWDEEGYYNEFQVLATTAPITSFSNIDSTTIIYSGTVYNTEATLTNLTPETKYYVYVRSDCQDTGDYTAWVGGEFTTLAVAYLPYVQNFNNAVSYPGNVYFANPLGWTAGAGQGVTPPFVYKGGSKSDRAPFSIDSTAYLSFNGSLSATPSTLAANQFAYIASPEIMDSSLDGLEIDFWATAYDMISYGSHQYASSLIVGVMDNPADFQTFTPIDTVTVGVSYQHRHYHVSLHGYQGSAKYVALASRFDKRNAIYVDNFSMQKPTALVPANVRVVAPHVTGFTVLADAADADSWEVMVSTEYSRDGSVSPTSVLYSAASLTGAQHEVLVADSSLAGQMVRVYVRSEKNGEASAWSAPVTLRVPTAMVLPYTNSCEVAGGQQYVRTLADEVRTNSTQQAMSSVFYPVRALPTDVKLYPTLASTTPNYRGAHAVLEGAGSWFALPEVSNVSEVKMIFRLATLSGKRASVEVGVMTDPYDASTFTRVSTFSTDESSRYMRCLTNFDSYTGDGKYIAIRALSANVATVGSENLIDEIQVDLLGECREASNMQVKARATEATVTWNGSGMDAWIVGFSTDRTFLRATYQTVDTPMVVFPNLESEHTYYYTVQTICGSDTMELDDVYYSFVTPKGLPFVETFRNSSLPTGWTRASGLLSNVFEGSGPSSTSDTYWSFSNSYVYAPQSGYAAYINIYGEYRKHWLISPELQLPDGVSALELTFDAGVYSYRSSTFGADDKFAVLVSTDGGQTWTRENATIWSNDADADRSLDNEMVWSAATTYSVDFTPYIGQTIKFAFYGESTVSNEDNYLSIDNIDLHVDDASCGGLSNLNAVAMGSDEARISWTLGGIDPYPAVVEVSANSTFTQIVQSATIQGNQMAVLGLESSHHYYVRARQNCPAGSDWILADFMTACEPTTIADFGEETFTSQDALDCWAVGFADPHGSTDKPQQVNANNFGGVLRITKSTVGETASDGAYAITPEFEIPDSINHYQVVFKAGAFGTDATDVNRLEVGVITDASDLGTFTSLATVNLQRAADSLELKTYVVSFEDYIGDIDDNFGRRVMFYSVAGGDSTNHLYIDNVSLEPAQGCHQVLNLEADSIGASSALLRWAGNGESYDIVVTSRMVNPDTVTTSGIRAVATGERYRVRGLEPQTTYYAYIRTRCGADETARWSSATRFTTGYGIPFFEDFSATTFGTGTLWSRYTGTFKTDSVKTSSLSTSTKWDTKDMTGSTTMSGISSYVAQINTYSSSDWFVSPVLSLVDAMDSEIRLSFKLALSHYSTGKNPNGAETVDTEKRFAVVVSEDGGLSWHQRNATFWAGDGSGQYNYNELSRAAKRYNIDLTKYAGKNIRVGFYAESNEFQPDLDLYVDSIQIDKFEAICLGVRQLQLSLRGDSAAVASWSIFGTPDSVALEFATDADFINVLRRDTTQLDSMVYSNLEYNRTYYVRASQVGCTGSSVANVSTPLAMPYTEPFALATLPSSWTMMKGNVQQAFHDTLPQVNVTSAWSISTASNGLPANHLLGELYKQTSTTESWLVSPAVLLHAEEGENVGLVFDLALTQHGKADAVTSVADQEFRVLVSTDNGQHWQEQNSWLFADQPGAFMQLSTVSATGSRIQIDLSEFLDQKVNIAFYKASAHATNDNDLHIANVQLRVIGEPCQDPSDLAADSVSFTIARVSWQGVADKTTLVEYSPTQDFSAAIVDTVVGGTTHLIEGLRPATTYYVRVMTICGENSTSGYSNTVTLNTSIGLPYEQTFGGTALPSDWKRYTSTQLTATPDLKSATAGWLPSTKTAILGANHIYCQRPTSSNGHRWIISPEIDLTPNTEEKVIALNFDMSFTGKNDAATAPTASAVPIQHFYVMISTDDGATWNMDDRWVWSAGDTAQFAISAIPVTGKNYQLDITRFGGQKIRVALVRGWASTGTNYINIANFNIVAIGSNCFGVDAVRAEQVDTAAVVRITPKDEAHQWELAWGKTGTPLLDMPRQVVDSVVATIGGLKLNSTYDIYARSICAEGDTSEWSRPSQFDTPMGLPYAASFHDNLCDWARFSANPDSVFAGRDTLKVTSNGWTYQSSSSYAMSAPHVYCARSATDYWLVSPEVNLMDQKGDDYIYLSMDVALTSTSTSTSAPSNTKGHSFRVAISEDGGATWQADGAILFIDTLASNRYKDIPAGGKTYHFDVTRFAGKNIRIALIMGAASSSYSSTIHVANLELEAMGVPCFGIYGLHGEYASGKAVVGFATDDASTTWQYTYGLKGFRPSENNLYTINDTTFAIYDLGMSSTYDIYVRSLCSAEDTTVWYGPVTVQTPIGVRYEEPMNWTELGEGWTNNTAWSFGPCQGVFGSDHAYVNTYNTYVRTLSSPQIDLASVANKSVAMTFEMALTAFSSYASTSTTANPPYNTTNQSFEVIVSEDKGQTWEVVAAWGGENGDYDYASIPVAGASYQVDLSDYAGSMINIGFRTKSQSGSGDNFLHLRNLVVDTIQTAACATVTRISLMDSTYTTATIALRAPGIQNALQLEYKCVPQYSLPTSAKAVSSDTNVVIIKGLQSSSAYELYARTMCQDSMWTEWAGPFLFHTVECTSVTGVTSSALQLGGGSSTITLSARDAAKATGYQLFVTEKDAPIDETKVFDSRNTTFNFTYDFQPSQWYDVYGRKICEPGDTSAWAGPFTLQAPLGIRYEAALDQVPHGWTDGHTGYSSGWQFGTRSNYGFEGVHAYVNTYSNYTAYLRTPDINLMVAHEQPIYLTFDLALTHFNDANPPTSTTGQSFKVRASTNGGTSWQDVAVWSDDSGSTYSYRGIPTTGENYRVDLSEYANQTVRLSFEAIATQSGPDNDIHMRNVVIDTLVVGPDHCQGVDSVAISGVGLNSATLSYVFRDKETTGQEAYLEVATDPSFTTVIMMDTLRSQTYQLTGLQPSTKYFARVAQLCDEDELSAWAPSVNFTTKRGIRYFEDFENASGDYTAWRHASSISADSVFNGGKLSLGTSGRWSRSPAAKCMSSAHIRMNVYDSKRYGWAVTPTIDMTPNAGEPVLLSFDVALCYYSASSAPYAPQTGGTDDQFMVIVSTDGGQTWSKQNAFIWNSNNNDPSKYGDFYSFNGTPQRVMLDFSRFAGDSVRIAFYAESTVDNADNYLMIDNVDLNVTRSYSYCDTICSSAEYDNYGFHFDMGALTPGVHQMQRISAEMDSIVNLELHVERSYEINLTDTICEGEIYTGYGYNIQALSSDIYRRRLEATNGCDSLVLLDLTVLPTKREDIHLYACKGSSYVLNGVAYYTNAVVRDTTTSLVTGCDSVNTYFIHFSDESSYSEIIRMAIAPGDSLVVDDEHVYYERGNHVLELSSIGGCDSTIYVYVLTADISGAVYDTVNVLTLPYIYDGNILLREGAQMQDYTFSIVLSDGTIGTLRLTVNDRTDITNSYLIDERRLRKVIRDNHLFIEIDDRRYDATGHLVE